VKGLADDKEKLRSSLGKGVHDALTRNLHNAPLLGTKTIAIFEFGNVFKDGGERRKFAFAFATNDKVLYKKEVDGILNVGRDIAEKLNLNTLQSVDLNKEIFDTERLGIPGATISGDISSKNYILEVDFDTMIEKLPSPTTYEAPTFSSLPAVSYKAVSAYPFITRDIAMWVPGDVTWESVSTLCSEVHNPLVARIDLFDTFSKEIEGVKKTSYAFRLVFQSYEKTLTDDEVNNDMEAYYALFKEKGYTIR
jgi:phenylalanyl-tRNA synthetase beta chain